MLATSTFMFESGRGHKLTREHEMKLNENKRIRSDRLWDMRG